jgi:nicotinamidase-related amidase
MIALLVVDMINAFVEAKSPFCVRGAKESVPNIEKAIRACRAHDIPIFFIARRYRFDGSDVEVSRWRYWVENKRPMTEESAGYVSGDF